MDALTPQKIVISPLNWGLGHASRCIPLIRSLQAEGHEVIIAASGPSALLLQQEFPSLRCVDLPSFSMRYSKGTSQVWAVLKAFPDLVRKSRAEHVWLQDFVQQEKIDWVISDNRFGFFAKGIRSTYITHQVFIILPRGFRFLEGILARWHAKIMSHFTEVWVPDYPEPNKALAGELSHGKVDALVVKKALSQNLSLAKFRPKNFPPHAHFIGPLTRFAGPITGLTSGSVQFQEPLPDVYEWASRAQDPSNSLTLAVLSGAEPQRSIWEAQLLDALQLEKSKRIVLVEGLPQDTVKKRQVGKIEVISHLPSEELRTLLLQATHIVCRSGYSSVMDLAFLGKLRATTWVPTPGQPEQEYLADYLSVKL